MKKKFPTPTGFRRLRKHEIVSSGDFVVSADQTMELWKGVNGFFADSYVTPIYRATRKIAAPAPRAPVRLKTSGNTP